MWYHSTHMNTNDKANKFFLPAAVILAGLFIAGAVMWSSSHPTPASGGDTTATVPTKIDVKDMKTAGNPFIGKADAPVTIAFWSDFQCPYCKAVEVGGVPQITTPEALPDIIKNYVDTGKVKIVFMDVAFLGNDSITGALYSHAVWNLYPDRYFEWRTAMYKAQDAEGDVGFGNAASIDKLDVTIAGLDAGKIAADVKANGTAYKAIIDSNSAELQKISPKGSATPSFLIGTHVLAGAYPYAAFQEAIDAELK